MSLPETFRYEVDENGCWIWAGYCDKNGYARIYNRSLGRIEWAHRYSFEQHLGPIRPSELYGLHSSHVSRISRGLTSGHSQRSDVA